MVLCGVFHNGQAKAGADGLLGMALIHTIEALKYLVMMLGCNANTGVLNAQANRSWLLGNRYFDAATRVVVLDGVVAEAINDRVQ